MSHLKAKLLWDGAEVLVPAEMGEPHPGQMQGTTGEQIIELAARICYDSLGSGRDTNKTLANLLTVGHLSVAEHYMVPIRIVLRDPDLPKQFPEAFAVLLNRPGLCVRFSGPNELRMTANPRTALDWDKITKGICPELSNNPAGIEFRDALRNVFYELTPLIIPEKARPWSGFKFIQSACVVVPEADSEKWISMYMSGSRGFTHELVRHGDFTAISQRSTRYVDENESPWVTHPLLDAYLEDLAVPEAHRQTLREQLENCVDVARHAYLGIIDRLESWLLGRIDPEAPYQKHTARKQARGAARGFLGNALKTELIFSASVNQWRHMNYMRAADAADAEIREIFIKALDVLKASRYGDRFKDLEVETSSDRIGFSLVGGGHK